MKTYPVMLDVRGRLCVVVGAGPVGLRKARTLAECGAKVRLVATDAHDLPKDFPGVELVRGRYEANHLAGALLAFACTDDPTVNSTVATDARAAGALVNVADSPDECDFYVPAVATDGDVVLAVGTGGSAPALAAALKRQLADHLPPRVGEFAEALRQLRREVHARLPEAEQRRKLLGQLAGADGYNAFARAGLDGLRELTRALLAGR